MLSSVSHSEAQADGGATFRSCLGDCGRGRDGWDDMSLLPGLGNECPK